jgi:hypothetical protein
MADEHVVRKSDVQKFILYPMTAPSTALLAVPINVVDPLNEVEMKLQH